MKSKMIVVLCVGIFVFAACKQETPPPPQPVAPAPVAQAQPPAPTVVYASAEPQHGGVTQKIGDYMVELATGAEGKIDVYAQKYEGAIPSFDQVQLEVKVEPRPAEGSTAPEPPPAQDVIFYSADGKLQGTVGGLARGAYDVAVSLYDQAENAVEARFENVSIDPLPTDMAPKHDGVVSLVEKTKMEVVREGQFVRVYLRDLTDKPLPVDSASFKQFVVTLRDGSKEEVAMVPEGDHYSGEVKGEVDEANFKVIMARLDVAGKEFPRFRLAHVPTRAEAARRKPKAGDELPQLRAGEAQKGTAGAEMKGTIGTMSLADKTPPGQAKPKPEPAADTEPAGKKTKTSKGPATDAKKAGEAEPAGKKTKTSKGPATDAKKAH